MTISSSMMRVLFLFNHDAAHQAAHIASIAEQLAQHDPNAKVIVACGTKAICQTVKRIIQTEFHERIEWIDLPIPPAIERWLAPFNYVAPVLRLARLRYNLNLFANVDMLVSTERTCLRIKRWLGPRAPKMVYVPHGSGDRDVAYHPDLAGFDLMLLSGPKPVDEMVRNNIVARNKCRIIGYPKFDTINLNERTRFFDNNRPVFVYNPHFDPYLSSWYTMGDTILDYFLLHPEYNLIVAPHVMLFRKRFHYSLEYRQLRRRQDVARRFYHAANILIDLNGPNLFDMSYTLAADAYIGDVSSQVYEFLLHRRACFFLDPLGAPSEGPAERYEFWRNGEVIYDRVTLEQRLPLWRENAAAHLTEQDRLFRYTIDHQAGRTAGKRGAEAIAEFLAGCKI